MERVQKSGGEEEALGGQRSRIPQRQFKEREFFSLLLEQPPTASNSICCQLSFSPRGRLLSEASSPIVFSIAASAICFPPRSLSISSFLASWKKRRRKEEGTRKKMANGVSEVPENKFETFSGTDFRTWRSKCLPWSDFLLSQSGCFRLRKRPKKFSPLSGRWKSWPCLQDNQVRNAADRKTRFNCWTMR